MIGNYFYLARCLNELQPLISNAVATEVYSQEKDTLFLDLLDQYSNRKSIIISLAPSLPYLLLKEEHYKSKKNVRSFFKDLFPAQILNLKIALYDRVILLELSSCSVYVVFRGVSSNVLVLVDHSNAETFKKTSEEGVEKIIEEINSIDFISAEDIHDLYATAEMEVNERTDIRKKYPFLGKEIRNFLEESNDTINTTETYRQIIKDIIRNDIIVGAEQDISRIEFAPDPLIKNKNLEDRRSFQSYNEALQYWLEKYHYLTREIISKKELTVYLEKEENRLEKRKYNLNNRIESGCKEELYRRYGNLLLLYLNRWEAIDGIVKLIDPETNEEINVPLIEKYSATELIDYYFAKSRDEKINFYKSIDLLSLTEQKIENIKRIRAGVESASTSKELESIRERLGLGKSRRKKKKDDIKLKFWHYIIDEVFEVFVGKDSKSNDILSIKFAKQNDYWFHVRGLPGSHVVLRVKDKNQTVQKSVIKKCASIAAYHSKAKTAGTVPVIYTRAKYVSKRKGMHPGEVNVQKESVLLVEPKIPENCILRSEIEDNF